MYAKIQEMLAENPKSVLLNGGDNFQGTLYYTLGKWNITQEFMNKLPFDATVSCRSLGNGNHTKQQLPIIINTKMTLQHFMFTFFFFQFLID